MIRAPETDPNTRKFEEELHGQKGGEKLRVGFSTASELAFELLGAVTDGEIVAIQGDRVTPGVASIETVMFGKRTLLPSGPFALAMAARVTIYPMFVVRTGRRRYALVATEPIELQRTSRNRDDDLRRGIEAWRAVLEATIAKHWAQWFTFEPFSPELEP
jgi:predicted LPLAT superfamily acyltransferase